MTPATRVDVDLGPGVAARFTTVVDGNLGTSVGDDPAEVARRRRDLARSVGVPVRFVHQVHGADVEVCAPGAGALLVDARAGRDEPVADALVTTGTDLALAVVVADCVPVLLADPVHGVVAAVHAGRRGLVAGVVQATVTAMVAAGARTADLRAVVGPAICGGCYEVPSDLRDEVEAVVPGTAALTTWGTPSLDLPAGVAAQLAAAGVAVLRSGACTRTDERYFSHRASLADPARPAGRFAALVRRTPGVSPRLP